MRPNILNYNIECLMLSLSKHEAGTEAPPTSPFDGLRVRLALGNNGPHAELVEA